MTKLKVLAIADYGHWLHLSKVLQENPDIDVILTLWDLCSSDLEDIITTSIPKLGVYWNHCAKWYFRLIWIENLHLQIKTINWITFWWFEWCVRYKPGWDVLYTQEESVELVKSLTQVDILVLHSPPFGINNNLDDPHIWLIWTKNYVDEFSPKHIFHWHTYYNSSFIEKYKDTYVHYVNWMKVIEIEV